METVIKILGLLIVLLACSALGFLKSYEIKLKTKNLKGLIVSLKQLSEYILCEKGEVKTLLNRCFGENVFYQNGNIDFDKKCYEKEVSELLEEFFFSLGKRDKKAENERTKFYIKLFENRLDLWENKASQLCKLYNSLGFFGGLFICIFFL